MQIDFVIAWVDGNDPKHKEKMAPYLNPRLIKSDDVAGPTRFRSVGEIYYCVASIIRFAPFIRKIFIVTDNQNPNLDYFIQNNFPENQIPIEIIDHKVIFRDYEDYLPVFNSRTIETCIYRIPDLSENYIYMNDDTFLIRPVLESDFFVGDKIVSYGSWRNMLLDRLLWLIKPLKNGRKPVGFKDGMIMGARKYGRKWKYFHLDHLPHPLKKSVIADYFSKNQSHFISNISHKFRSGKQFNTHEIFYLSMHDARKAILKPSKEHLLYIKPVKRGKNYLNRKLNLFETNKNLKFCCMGSLDLATEDDRKRLLDWLGNNLNLNI